MKNKTAKKCIYIILLDLAFLSACIKDFFVSTKGGFVIMLLFIAVAFIKLCINKFKVQENKNILKIYLKNNLTIKIALHIYTFFLILLGVTEARFLSTNLFTYINAVSAIAIVFLIGEMAWNVAISSVIIAWLVAIVWQIVKYGTLFYEHLELNDLAFATGYLLLYYIIINKKWRVKDILRVLVAFLIIVVAAKRIGIAALIVAILFNCVYKFLFKNKKIGQLFIDISSITMFILFYFFVYIIVNGSFFEFIDGKVDNVPNFLMGRNYYWKVLANMCVFSPNFLGYGRNASATLFTTDYAYMNVGNVHSDILKVYMESGFILFGIWLAVYLFKFRKEISKKISQENAYIFFICTMYTFLVYITDNTETYLITQFFYMLIPIVCGIKEKKKNLKIKT